MIDSHAARVLVDNATFIWHQRFELAPGVFTPGGNDIGWLIQNARLPDDLRGKSVLDIGTTNGGAAFEMERRGADRVVAVDIFAPDFFGFDQLSAFLGSRAQYLQASVYELASVLDEQFDLVLFWGVLYHLRHPLLALDNVYAVLSGEVSIETAVADEELDVTVEASVARFYRHELYGDTSNWFVPTLRCLLDWCSSSGLEPIRTSAWPVEGPTRSVVHARRAPGPPEYQTLSYEQPLLCRPQRRTPM